MPGKDKGRGKGKIRGKAPDKITVGKVHFYPIRTGSQQNGPKSVIIGNTYYHCLRGGYPEWLRANRSTEMAAEAATARGVQKIQDGELSEKSLSQGEDISDAPDRIIEYIRRDDAIMVSEIPEDEIGQSIRVNTHHPDVRCPPRVHDCTTCNERRSNDQLARDLMKAENESEYESDQPIHLTPRPQAYTTPNPLSGRSDTLTPSTYSDVSDTDSDATTRPHSESGDTRIPDAPEPTNTNSPVPGDYDLGRVLGLGAPAFTTEVIGRLKSTERLVVEGAQDTIERIHIAEKVLKNLIEADKEDLKDSMAEVKGHHDAILDVHTAQIVHNVRTNAQEDLAAVEAKLSKEVIYASSEQNSQTERLRQEFAGGIQYITNRLDATDQSIASLSRGIEQLARGFIQAAGDTAEHPLDLTAPSHPQHRAINTSSKRPSPIPVYIPPVVDLTNDTPPPRELIPQKNLPAGSISAPVEANIYMENNNRHNGGISRNH
ncbi:hypothetical protein L211DRAFT_851225 [Terfezia boudieri ATCC MYA-4762]|uniref:Uncharacterized protein n=1 Tax=Terfezia boudieri ATCC MYA-4762 TaxID=1051890 RepID=A0A3N4LFV1_9PEZI|nr:hypothetical protein L211DRAFT_851225 [Terfezia boudieri ATCC MYA-4762]